MREAQTGETRAFMHYGNAQYSRHCYMHKRTFFLYCFGFCSVNYKIIPAKKEQEKETFEGKSCINLKAMSVLINIKQMCALTKSI